MRGGRERSACEEGEGLEEKGRKKDREEYEEKRRKKSVKLMIQEGEEKW